MDKVSGVLFDEPLPVARRARHVPLRKPQARSAQDWSDAFVAETDPHRKQFCYAQMIAALLALDGTRAGGA